ncbi:MAG: IS66 family transposase [Desulfobulbaceae bacterium]|nr:IS66 family transposase [Desulfobulbaceae bacterium]
MKKHDATNDFDIPLDSPLTEELAKEIISQGEEAVVFALLELSKRVHEKQKPSSHDDPSCPSGQKPVFAKPNKKDKKGKVKKKGRKKGHKGSRRKKPDRVDRTEVHRADECPDCGKKLKQCSATRERFIEDIPENTRIEIVKHIIHRDWCPDCRKAVEPVVTDALPKSSIGNGIVVLCAWLHYSLGNTISQILDVFNYHLQFKVSQGGLVQIWHRLADILTSWYEEIIDDIQNAGVLHGDETGWRVDGKTHWLWCFTSERATIFTVDKSRAGPVVLNFIKECFDGVFVSDFWYAYSVLDCAKQKCLVHLLRDLERVEKYKDSGDDWPEFCKKLKRMIRDAIKLQKQADEMDKDVYMRRCQRIEDRLQSLISKDWVNKEALRLIKRLKRHQDEIFTFLHHTEVPFDNNFGERSIRGAVIMRKNSFNNRSNKGAFTQSVLMSVFFTLKQRKLNPVSTVKAALKTYTKTGKLPKLKELSASSG